MASDLAKRHQSKPAVIPTWQPSETTSRLLAAGEDGLPRWGEGGQFEGTHWTPPQVPDSARRDLLNDEAALRAKLDSHPNKQWIVNNLASLSLVCGRRSDMTEVDATAQLHAIAAELVEYPSSCIERGIRNYGRENKWMPVLAEILPYVERERDALKATHRKLRQMLGQHGGSKARKAWQPPTEAERERAREQVREFVAAMRAKDAEEAQSRKRELYKRQDQAALRERLPEGEASKAARGAPFQVLGKWIYPSEESEVDEPTGAEQEDAE